jgi:hypothetical protein
MDPDQQRTTPQVMEDAPNALTALRSIRGTTEVRSGFCHAIDAFDLCSNHCFVV